MKKPAKHKIQRTPKVKAKSSLLLVAVLILAIVGFVVWAVIAKSPGKTPHAQTAPSTPTGQTLSVSWNTPVGYVSFADAGNKKANCFAQATSCSTAPYTYWPNSNIDYLVQVNSTNGPALQKGMTMATADGRAVANWNWRYEVNVFLDSYSSCAAAGSNCVIGQVTGNMFIANNLMPLTFYRMVVCAPGCANGVVVQNTTARTDGIVLQSPPPKIYSLSAVPSSQNIVFNWTPPLEFNSGTLGLYYEDMTQANTQNCSSIVATHTGSNVGAVTYDLKSGQSSFTWNATPTVSYGSFQSGHKYCVYLVQWTTSAGPGVPISNFLEVTTPLAIKCWQVDFNHDGSVSILDLVLMARFNGTKLGDPKYNVIYDLNGDGLINIQDFSIAAKFYGQKCTPMGV